MYKCKKCNDSFFESFERDGYSYVTRCDCYFLYLKKKKFGQHYELKTLENYEERSPTMAEAKQILLSSPEKSYFITGSVGLGKTHLLVGIFDAVLHLRKIQPEQIFVMTELQLLDSLNKKTDEVEDLSRYTTFIIDDIGKTNLAKWDIEKFYAFYNEIYRQSRTLVVSSNYSISDISEIYGGAIARRIDELASVIEIKAPEQSGLIQ